MKKILIGGIAVVLCAVLTGCVPAAPTRQSPKPHLTQVPSSTPTPSVDPSAVPLAEAVVDTVVVDVYAQKAFKASHGCGCKVSKTATEELYPKGTPVMMLRITLTGNWKPSQGSSTMQDVTGVNLKGTKFDGRPDDAVLDTVDGKKLAAQIDQPWLPEGLFQGKSTWSITNDVASSFVAAWYVPNGVDQLLLTVDTPSEPFANNLTISLPADVVKLLVPSGE